ncbi:MAG TPA: hypothetical protein VH540_20960 [Ktedonobacterales bacterium]|jgi:hypothetical protein
MGDEQYNSEGVRWTDVNMARMQEQQAASSFQESERLRIAAMQGPISGTTSTGSVSGGSAGRTRSSLGKRLFWAIALVVVYFLWFSQNVSDANKGLVAAIVIGVALLIITGLLGRLMNFVIGLLVLAAVAFIAFQLIVGFFAHP